MRVTYKFICEYRDEYEQQTGAAKVPSLQKAQGEFPSEAPSPKQSEELRTLRVRQNLENIEREKQENREQIKRNLEA